MDSAKKQKLFPDFSLNDLEEENQVSEAPSDFQMNDGVWESLLREPMFEKQLRSWIDRMAAERVQSTIEKMQLEAREQGHREGYEAGLNAGRQALESALQMMHDVSAQLVSEKTNLLASHEQLFCEALMSLLEKLAVPETQTWMSQIEGILEKYKMEFTEKGRIEISVSEAKLKELESAGVKIADGLRWSIKANSALAANDIQVDFGGVGLQLLPTSLVQEWQSALNGDLRKTG